MSDYIDTRNGWREVSSGTYATARGPRLREDPSPDDNGLSRYWVREEPMPPLPSEPFSVIRAWVAGAEDPRIYVRSENGVWFRAGKTSTLRADVLRWESLAVPPMTVGQATVQIEQVRRETAEAIRARYAYWRSEGWAPDTAVTKAIDGIGVQP